MLAKKMIDVEIEKNGGDTLPSEGNLYQTSFLYLKQAIMWNLYERKLHVMKTIMRNIRKDESVLDLGCASGVTGLTLRHYGYDVYFSDYAGAPEKVVRNLEPDRFYPYGEEPVCDWVVSLDVIEHVANPLSFVRWIYDRCRIGTIITFPIMSEWQAPYRRLQVDNHVDIELLLPAIKKLFRIQYCKIVDNGYEIVLKRRNGENK